MTVQSNARYVFGSGNSHAMRAPPSSHLVATPLATEIREEGCAINSNQQFRYAHREYMTDTAHLPCSM